MALMKSIIRNTSLAHRLSPCTALVQVQSRSGVTDTQRFREVWHNTDSVDFLYEKCKKPTVRLDPTRRAHYYVMFAGCYGAGIIMARNIIHTVVKYISWPADVLAVSALEVKLGDIPEGKCVTALWKGSPVFIWHRSDKDISNARRDDTVELRDPQTDAERVKDPKWYISMAVCTHLGCIPQFGAGNYDGFFCPCHGSHYDASGRIRKGPAPANLEIPAYKFTEEGTVIIGKAMA